MKKKMMVFLGILAVMLFSVVGAGQYETNYYQLVLEEYQGADAFILFESSDGTDIAKIAASDADANAECLIFDVPVGGATVVPVVLLTITDSDFGYFNGVTEPAYAVEDADGDSWISIGFSADDTPEIQVGGAASTLTLPAAISGYTATDDLDWGFGTGTPASMEYTTADANANCVIVDLPTGGATDVPVMFLTQTDADFGYFDGVTQTTFGIEDTDGDSYAILTFSADDTFVIDVGGSATTLGFVDNVLFGVDATGVDAHFYGDTTLYQVWWDQNADTNGSWFFGDDDYGVDVWFRGVTASQSAQWDASADSMLFGVDDDGVDVKFFGATASAYALWDESEDEFILEGVDLGLQDSDVVNFGDANDVTMTWNGSAFVVASAGAASPYTFGATSHVFNVTQHGTYTFGVNDTGYDIKAFTATAGSYLIVDESIDSLVAVDVDVKLDDDAILYFGTGTNVTTADGDFTANFTDGAPGYLTITAVTAEDVFQIGDGTIATDVLIQNTTTAGADIFWDDSGELWKFGVDDTGIDVGFYGDTAGDFILFDESGDELIVEDITVNIMDDTILSFGDGDDVTINYDEDGDNDLQITGPVTFEGAVVVQSTLTMTGTGDTWDPGSLADGVQESKDFTVVGAALGDASFAGAGVDVVDILVSCVVTAADTVTVTLANETGGTVDLASSTWYVYVILDD